MTRTRYLGDAARANWSSLAALVVGVAFATGILSAQGRLGGAQPWEAAVLAYLSMWPVFGALYVAWTHLSYSRSTPETLRRRSRRETQMQQRWWSRLFGYGGAASWTLSAALAAIVLTLVIAQDQAYRGDALYVVLGFMCVASSWALMAYAFTLQYLRLDANRRTDEPRPIEFEIPDDTPTFADVLTFTILLSTMASVASGRVHSREAWALVRTNVLFAFTFNSVIVAMVVSLLIGGLIG